ncbi:Orn/Lys/Arg decarboxylase N-terminal domain-containing protein [Ferrimonas gelatinilytica]|uniref:Lysine-specific pyridoxal 5'-phosphate-dependent carboxylase LdcA n=1 Tax=Ferrimonas gelatinilytica TaxID=1255257 RepID=A0ABP9RZN3_9GAMM
MSTFSPLPPALARTFPVLIIADTEENTAIERSAKAIKDALEENDIHLVVCRTLNDGEIAISSEPAYSCVVIGWGLCQGDQDRALALIALIQDRCEGLPVLLSASKNSGGARIPLAFAERIDGAIWLPEDSPKFIAGRIQAAAKRYLDSILPPFFGAMVNFADTHEYSWHTPGHTGGTAFMKTAVGRTFLNFYGEQMLRSDLSVSVGELGSLNDHSGPVAEAEAHAARVFGADYTFFSVGGSSASNEIILHSAVTDNDAVMVDRNCHKSLNYALNMSGAMPVYLIPRRNARGVIGPVPASELTPKMIKQKIADSPLVEKSAKPVLAVLTNSTYDGLCYNVETTTRLLSDSVPRIHYDEAWYAYARFNPIYEGRYGMHQGERHPDDATITVTHSTHKLLAALSQASMIHIRSGKVPVKPALFNEAFMMHTSTSPQYSIIASTDVSAKMMADSGGYLTDESIQEAVTFRQSMARLKQEVLARNSEDWWFDVWQPDHVHGQPFHAVEPETLTKDSSAWVLKPGDKWHGFGDLGDDYCMLDPIKVTVLSPGMDQDGNLESSGIPGPLISSFLSSRGIVVEKTEPYSFLLLFSVGTTKGKWGSLVAGLMEFKHLYDTNHPLSDVMPDLVASHPKRYQSLGLKDLADEMHQAMIDTGMLTHMDAAFTKLPTIVHNPRETYAELVRGNIEEIPVSKMAGRVVAVQVVPYPPGIPLMMPGEKVTKESQAIVDYLLALQAFDTRFPGFEHDTHGVEIETDAKGRPEYVVYCLKAK